MLRVVPTEAELARPEGLDYEPASALLERAPKLTSASIRAGTSRATSFVAVEKIDGALVVADAEEQE